MNTFSNEDLEGMAHGDNPVANAYRELLAFRRNSPVVPPGYVLVPVKPTPEMLRAGFLAGEDDPGGVYRAMLEATPEHGSNDVTTGKPLTITLPDITSKAFWSGTGKSETFHPETYKRWVKETIERACVIAGISVVVK